MSLRGYFVAFSKCTVLLSLRILLLVPAGLPVRSQGDSQSDNKVMDNITVRQGETVFLRWVNIFPVFKLFYLFQLSLLTLLLTNSIPKVERCLQADVIETFSGGEVETETRLKCCLFYHVSAVEKKGGFQRISLWKTLNPEAILS